MIPIVVLVAVVLHGNTSATKGTRNSDSCQDEMPMYGTAHMARLQIEESSQLTKGNSRRMKGLDAHIRNNPKVPLSHACEGLRDRRGSASCSLVLSINSRGFCREIRVSSALLLASTLPSLSLSCFIACFVLGFIIAIHWWSRVYTTHLEVPTRPSKISSEIQFSEKRIESPSDTYGYRVCC